MKKFDAFYYLKRLKQFKNLKEYLLKDKNNQKVLAIL